MTTPAYIAPVNGDPQHLRAVNAAAHVNQLLGAHASNEIYYGTPVVTATGRDGAFDTDLAVAARTRNGNSDLAQKFTMSGTTIGRITVPVKSVGNGCDLLVTLCPDNAGVPNTNAPIAQTKLTAGAVSQLSASLGLAAGGPLATPSANLVQPRNFTTVNPWTSPAASLNGTPSFYSEVTNGNFSALLGGFDSTASAAVANVSVTAYTGSTTVGLPVPQQSLPVATFYGSSAYTNGTIIYAGGSTSAAPTAKVWSAGFDPNTGAISNWASQPDLPVSIQQGGAVGYNNVFYVLGGTPVASPASAVNTVYMSTSNNGQLGAWSTSTPLPAAICYPLVAALNGWLIVAGGLGGAGTVVQSATYYAKIDADGSLGPWLTGPVLPTPVYAFVPQWCTSATDSAMIVLGGLTAVGGPDSDKIQILSVTANGPATQWVSNTMQRGVTVGPTAAFSDGSGAWSVIQFDPANQYFGHSFLSASWLSVPMGVTGLTNGASYWIVLQPFQSSDVSDSLLFEMNFQSYPTDTLVTTRHGNSWTAFISGFSLPLNIYDMSVTGPLLHILADQNTTIPGTAPWQYWSNLIYGTAGGRNGLLIGTLDTVSQPNPALNSNPTFTTGTSPWTAVGGALTQSNAQTHGGFPFSGLLTPAGGVAAFTLSENIPITQTPFGSAQWALVSGFFYSPNGYSTFELRMNWADSSGAYLSTSLLGSTSLAAATWTQVFHYAQVPVGAAFGSINPVLSGTPLATDLLYMSNVFLVLSPETVPALTSASQVVYNSSGWPPIEVNQLV